MFNQELRAEAALHPDVKLIVTDGQDSVEKQAADVAGFIEQQVDAILISPKVAEGLTPIVSRAFEAGIPVFVLDRDLANDRYVQFIGGDNREIDGGRTLRCQSSGRARKGQRQCGRDMGRHGLHAGS
ncbi:substrate-binding domain-containing protein [Candidatus Reidiella endopervernicosa]|uniref:substrate-binding domain-containing protein n=1 Tax=Candidatus Reidiella endopervernicosa TaxID=2738883 RepID=UPI003B968247